MDLNAQTSRPAHAIPIRQDAPSARPRRTYPPGIVDLGRQAQIAIIDTGHDAAHKQLFFGKPPCASQPQGGNMQPRLLGNLTHDTLFGALARCDIAADKIAVDRVDIILPQQKHLAAAVADQRYHTGRKYVKPRTAACLAPGHKPLVANFARNEFRTAIGAKREFHNFSRGVYCQLLSDGIGEIFAGWAEV